MRIHHYYPFPTCYYILMEVFIGTSNYLLNLLGNTSWNVFQVLLSFLHYIILLGPFSLLLHSMSLFLVAEALLVRSPCLCTCLGRVRMTSISS